jgi:hypothetical protein
LAKDISHNDAPLKRQVQTYIAGDVGRFQLEISMGFLWNFYGISMEIPGLPNGPMLD